MSRLPYWVLVFCLSFSSLRAQVIFEQIPGPLPQSQFIEYFDHFAEGDAQFADFNGDGTPDLVLTGFDYQYNPTTRLYFNDGFGRFSESNSTVLPGVVYAAIAIANVDGDTDFDILFSGYDNSFAPITKLFLNDGSGNFTESMSNSFVGLANGNMAFADIDNDLDEDLIMTGEDIGGSATTLLYHNDGSGVFTQDLTAPFDSVTLGDIQIFDFDENGDQYMILSGANPSSTRITKLYKNDGAGFYSEVLSTPFDGLTGASITTGDVDGDLDIDIVIAGQNTAFELVTKLYLNDGIDNFLFDAGSSFTGVDNGMIELVDLDADNDLDLFVTGNGAGFVRIATFYINDGNGGFTENSSSDLLGATLSAVAFADIEDDGDNDFVLIGEDEMGAHSTSLYQNNGNAEMVLSVGSPFSGVYSGVVVAADYDNDNDLDVLISGAIANENTSSNLYANDGNGGYDTSSVFIEPLNFGDAQFADVDGDLDLDLLMNGRNSGGQSTTKMYLNNGFGQLDSVPTVFEQLSQSTIDFIDVDGDLDLDVFMTGRNNDFATRVSKLYVNDGNGVFSESMGSSFLPVYQSATTFGDVDGDLDLDIIVVGSNSFFPSVPTINMYINNGSGVFSNAGALPFEAQLNGRIELVDVDADGDLDFVQMGYRGSNDYFSGMYLNNGSGQFTPVAVPFVGLTANDFEVSDLNEDGFMDFIVSGYDTLEQANSRMYLSQGALIYSEDLSFDAVPLWASAMALFDVDADGDKDLVITGNNDINLAAAMIYINTSCFESRDTISVGACFNYVSPSGNIWTESDTYSDTLFEANDKGCDSIIVVELTIDTVNVRVQTLGSEITAESLDGDYQWLNCNASFAPISGETSRVFSANVNGDYAVEITINNCVDTSVCEVINIVNTENQLIQSSFVYPNPLTDHVTISNPFHNLSLVTIFGVDGELLLEYEFNSLDRIHIPWRFGKGVFTVMLRSGDSQYVSKVVKY